MTLIEAQMALMKLNSAIIQTSDASACLKVTRSHASKILERLAISGVVSSIARGLWVFNDKADLLTFPEYLTAPFPSYISLQTALYHHGMISQIPAVVYAVSLARTRQYHTPFGTVSIHHIDPGFFFGFDVVGKSNIKIASPEKALLDMLYFAQARSLLFRVSPEIELPENFNIPLVREMIKKIPSLRLKTRVEAAFAKIIKN